MTLAGSKEECEPSPGRVVIPIGSRDLLRMVLEVKVLPENGLGRSKDILRMVLDP